LTRIFCLESESCPWFSHLFFWSSTFHCDFSILNCILFHRVLSSRKNVYFLQIITKLNTSTINNHFTINHITACSANFYINCLFVIQMCAIINCIHHQSVSLLQQNKLCVCTYTDKASNYIILNYIHTLTRSVNLLNVLLY